LNDGDELPRSAGSCAGLSKLSLVRIERALIGVKLESNIRNPLSCRRSMRTGGNREDLN
jgi:hypothetical protein